VWIYEHYSTPIKITHKLYTVFLDSRGGATALLSNYAAAVSEKCRSLAEFSTV